MRVLFCVDDFKGGAGNVIQLLSIEFVKRGHHVAICCLGGNTPGRHNIGDIHVYRISRNSNILFRYITYVTEARKIIKKEKPDCVVSFLFGVSAFVNLAMVGMKTPLIVSERSDPNYLKPSGLLAVLTELAYKRAKNIVVLFDSFKDISNNKYRDKAVTIPNPVPKISCQPTDNHEYTDEVRFITIANDTPPKGLDLLVRAFAKVTKQHKNAVLRIYGKHSERLEKLVQDIGTQEHIQLMGYVLDVPKVLSWADVYVMPSRHEGFPNSLCEAMSVGKCCIATLCHDGIKDLVQDGMNGLIASKVSIDSLYEQITNIMLEPKQIKTLGEKAKLLSDKYDMERIVDLWEKLIENNMRK